MWKWLPILLLCACAERPTQVRLDLRGLTDGAALRGVTLSDLELRVVSATQDLTVPLALDSDTFLVDVVPGDVKLTITARGVVGEAASAPDPQTALPVLWGEVHVLVPEADLFELVIPVYPAGRIKLGAQSPVTLPDSVDVVFTNASPRDGLSAQKAARLVQGTLQQVLPTGTYTVTSSFGESPRYQLPEPVQLTVGQGLESAATLSYVLDETSLPLPTQMVIVGPTQVSLNECVSFTLELRDDNGIAAPARAPLDLSLNATGGSLFAGGICQPGESTQIAQGVSSFALSAVAAGTNLSLTVSATGFAHATLAVTGLDPLSVADLAFDISIDDLPWWREVALDANLPQKLWGILRDGRTLVSTDFGATWTELCRLPAYDWFDLGGMGMLHVSPGTAGHVYAGDHTAVYRIDNSVAGTTCINVAPGSVYGYANTKSLDFAPNGDLYVWKYVSGGGELMRTQDGGGAWELLFTDTVSSAYMGFMGIAPHDPSIILVDRAFAGAGQGLYRSDDAGATFGLVTSTGFNDSNNQLRFDPAHPGYVYKNGYVSDDDGVSWASSGPHAVSPVWAIDGLGQGYRFTGNATSTLLERAPDMRTPAFATLATFPHGYSDMQPALSVSSDCTRLATVLTGRMQVSNNSGSSFTDVLPPAWGGAVSPGNAVIADDGMRYMVFGGWLAAKALPGQPWELAGEGFDSYASPYIHLVPGHPSAVYVRPENFNSTYSTTLWSTTTGFTEQRFSATTGLSSWAAAGAVSIADPNLFYMFGYNKVRRTTDGGATFVESASNFPNVWYPSPAAFIHPEDPDKAWVVGEGELYEFSIAATTSNLLTARTGVVPAAIEMYYDVTVPTLRIVGSQGELVTSTNFATSFSTPTAATIPSCEQRLLSSAAGQRNVVATACLHTNTVYLSQNGGTAWRAISVPECYIQQLSMGEGLLYVSCRDRHPYEVQF